MKFKILPKVRSFTDAEGVEHLPGDIVDLPEGYKGETWLEPVEKLMKVEVPPTEIEAPKLEVKPETTFEAPKKGKKKS